jgi:coenzyme PQQ precursor peptide PqqA
MDDNLSSAGAFPRQRSTLVGKEQIMWKTPKIVEVAVGLEINSYACAIVA